MCLFREFVIMPSSHRSGDTTLWGRWGLCKCELQPPTSSVCKPSHKLRLHPAELVRSAALECKLAYIRAARHSILTDMPLHKLLVQKDTKA